MSDEHTAPQPQESAPEAAGAQSVMAPVISRRVGAILDAVEREAGQLRQQARNEADLYFDHAKRRADGLVEERRRRIAELSDELIAKSEAVVARLDDAAPVRAGFENLVRALGDAAERLAQERESTGGEFAPPPFHAVPPPDPAPAPPPQQAPWPQGPPAGSHAAPAGPPPPASAPPGFAPAGAPAPAASQAPPPQPPPATPPPAPPTTSWQPLDEARMIAIQHAATGATRGGVRAHLHGKLGIADSGGILDEVFGAGTGDDAMVPWSAANR